MASKKPKLTEQQLEKLAKTTETTLTELAKVYSTNRFEAKKAEMFALSADGFIRSLGKYGDVYEGLDIIGEQHTLTSEETAVVCQTCGWASPIEGEPTEDDVPPSQHPQKRRVRLTVLATRSNQMVSSIVFADTPDESIYDFGSARGSLADALKDTLGKMLANAK